MKKFVSYALASLLLSFGLSSNSYAILLTDGTDVGSVDLYLTVTDTLANSNPLTEEAFVDQYLVSESLDPVDFIIKLEEDLPVLETLTAENVVSTDVYAVDISTDLTAVADYFIVKNSTYWALYENIADVDWAVFDVTDLRADMNLPGDFTVSHITLFDATASVPEPGMLAVFGAGLVGLGFARRRRTAA